jgi:dUTP pyrophosphatase
MTEIKNISECVVKIKFLDPDARIPYYEFAGDAGADVFSTNEYKINQFERVLIPTGFSLEAPPGYEVQIRPRSGMALENGITVLNTPGTIDSSYRGEVKVLLINFGEKPYLT